MNNLWPSRATQDAAEPARPTEDVADTGEVAQGTGPGTGLPQLEKPPVPAPPTRPGLPRNALQPGPPLPPGPAPGRDTGPHAEEIDEWFVYQFWQWVRLNAAQKAFEWHWNHESGGSHAWEDADNDTRARFIQAAIAAVQSNDAALRSASIGKLVYLVLGRWGDTAMPNATSGESRSIASIPQLQAIKAGVECLTSLEGLPVIWEALRNCFEVHWSGDIQQQASAQEAQDELMNLMTIMYIVIQETLSDPEDMSSSYGKLLDLNPSLVEFMLTATSKLRWDEQSTMPHTQEQIFLLFWKSILLVFGGTKDLEKLKKATSEMTNDGQDKETITASPLDYHVFRQEITSKYPAYIPPHPVIPLEADNASLLPPLPHVSSRSNASNGILPTPAHTQSGGASILHQPVHIATPAPSPPPSPGVGGKGGKKQNYQTNQNFPFMYPPLDATSNSAGGKGMAGIHDALVSRRWEGSDIPASILEAGELFSSRVRMTRGTRQLWDERERFLKYERGWGPSDDDDDDIDGLSLDELTLEEKEVLKELKAEDKRSTLPPPSEAEVDFGPRPDRLSDRDKQRLVAVERFYSLVIVLLRPILVNVTAIVTQQAAQMPNGMVGRGNNPGINGGPAAQKPPEMTGQIPHVEEPEPSPEEIDAARTREITSKAMTGILVLLLKWLRISHVLKFEYFTQLLLDSNYIPLVLKLFAHQDIQQVGDSKMDRVENSFFQFCNLRSKFKDRVESDLEHEDEDDEGDVEEKHEDDEPEEGEESDDSAAPPPIKRRRSPEQTEAEAEAEEEEDSDAGSDGQASTRPEVDELGYPVNPLPAEPITDFSRRNFFSLINYLRVMQKICKNKAHRNLLLVQYKSSQILRKSLRVPQEELRLYTLKLFKNQVPYCGRKWRQSNMRVITAVYLHCRPELRDEWLAGSDVDAEVEGALPLEQALRSLTHWRNVRRYPDKIAAEIRTTMREEQDFFTRELEKLDVNWAEVGGDDGMNEMDHVEGWA
ncbi:Striatin-interacting protein 1 [Tolypocladium ophioglossoides CBS 100239]|uniref:Striatin-interacting protein 1 n=1 Tax=Tolypocladium ophioglossoides (strain CBS 100239) TaxID=1163406 RepID=A0A0L0NIR8_TOLOC|nr:Striatin-interacting protein 1 [Tolypocladium ophioglossoides CBS 100239]